MSVQGRLDMDSDDEKIRGTSSRATGARVVSFSAVTTVTEDPSPISPSLPPPRTFTDTDETEPPEEATIPKSDRDPHNINKDITVAFPDIFAEPDGLHSDDGVWVCAYKTYNGTRHWCYTICSFICAVPAAFIWGIAFACLAFCHIWYVVPFLKAFLIELKCIGRVFALCIKTFCDPIYSSIALTFSKIRVVFIRSSGEHEYP